MDCQFDSITPLVPSSLNNETPHTDHDLALKLAADYHREYQSCTDDAQVRQLCRSYRDKIVQLSSFADVLAAAFDNVFDGVPRTLDDEDDAAAWDEFAGLVKRQHKSRDRQSQRLKHQTCVVALWGSGLFDHYGWRVLPLDYTRLLHSLARELPDWRDAVEMINGIMLERHELRVVKGDNRALKIGEHSKRSSIQESRSPLERRDIQDALDRLCKKGSPSNTPRDRESIEYSIAGKSIWEHGLEQDHFEMIVPRSIRASQSSTCRSNKRRKFSDITTTDYRDSEAVVTTPLPERPHDDAICSPGSEITQLEEESNEEKISSSVDTHAGSRDENRFLWNGDFPVDLSSNAPSPMSSPEVYRSPTPLKGIERVDRRTMKYCDSHQGVRVSREDKEEEEEEEEEGDGEEEEEEEKYPDDQDEQEEWEEREQEQQATGTTKNLRYSKGTMASDMAFASSLRHGAATAVQSEEDSNTLDKATCETLNCRKASTVNPMEITRSHNADEDEDYMDSEIRNGFLTGGVDLEDPKGDHHQLDFNLSTSPGNTPGCCIPGEDEHENQNYAFEFDSGSIDGTQSNEETGDLDFEEYAEHAQTGAIVSPESVSPHKALLDKYLPCGPSLDLESSVSTAGDGSTTRYCTDTTLHNDGSLVGRMAGLYSAKLKEALDAARQSSTIAKVRRYRESQAQWLGSTQWASIYTTDEDISAAESTLAATADVWYIGWEAFKKRAESGEIFRKPIVIKQDFKDSGSYELAAYAALLNERFPTQDLDLQDCNTGECRKIATRDFCTAICVPEKERCKDVRDLAKTGNLINLRKIANSDAPLLTRLKRFRLLETLVDRASNEGPGKRHAREANDVADCLAFNLLGFEGAFSRPHVDALVGTWARCLFGAKAWIFVTDMGDEDWEDFAEQGPLWAPAGKGRMIILEKDDVLLMPPGLRVLHAVYTLDTSLMEGGMLWDEENIPTLLKELLWVTQNQLCTNEAVAYQLPRIVDALKSWVQENGVKLCAGHLSAGDISLLQQGIENLEALGCDCGWKCNSADSCQCRAQNRRCTAWCCKHPSLPGKRGVGAYSCMLE